MKATDLTKAQQEAKDKQDKSKSYAQTKPVEPPKPEPDDDDEKKGEAEELLDAVEAQSLSGDQQAALNKLRKLFVKKK